MSPSPSSSQLPASQVNTPTAQKTISVTPTSSLGLSDQDFKGVEVQLWQPWIGSKEEVLLSQINQFNQTNPWGIIVKVQTYGGIDELSQNVQTAWGSSNLPDLLIAYSFQAQNWQKIKSLVQDWQPYIDDSQWGIPNSEQTLYFAQIWQSSVSEGFHWGIPARRDGQVMFGNQSWVRELGYSTIPTSADLFRKQACAAASASKKDPQTKLPLSGGWVLNQDYPTILGWITAFNGKILTDDHKQYQFNNPEVTQAFLYLRQLYDDGCIIQLKDVNPPDALAEREGLFVTTNSAEISDIQTKFKLHGNSDQWTAFSIPGLEGINQITLYGLDYILLQSEPKTQLASWLFVKWMISQENQVELARETFSLPFNKNALEQLKKEPDLPQAYLSVLDGVPGSLSEPVLASWNTVRWMLADASRQLFAWYFEIDQLDNLLKLLDTSANGVNK